MKLVFADAARDDLVHIGERIAVDSPRRAVTFIDEVEAHCQRRAETPFTHPLLPGENRFVYGEPCTATILSSIGSIPIMSLSSA